MPVRPAPKPPTALETTPRNCPITRGMSATVDSNIRRSGRSLRILLVCTTCTEAFGNGCLINMPPAKEKPKQVRVNPLVAPNTLYPRAVKGGSWDDGASSHRSAASNGVRRKLEKTGPANSQERLVSHGRHFCWFSYRPSP